MGVDNSAIFKLCGTMTIFSFHFVELLNSWPLLFLTLNSSCLKFVFLLMFTVSCVKEPCGSTSFITSFWSDIDLVRSFCRLVTIFILAQRASESRCCVFWFAGPEANNSTQATYFRLQTLITPIEYLKVVSFKALYVMSISPFLGILLGPSVNWRQRSVRWFTSGL